MKNIAKKLYYLFLTILFQTFSTSATRLYLNLFKDRKSHPYIITGIYFISYFLFIIIFYLNLPKKKKNDSSESFNVFRKRANSIKLYKKNSIITIEEDKKTKKNKKLFQTDVYCIRNEVIYPSILLSIGQGMNIYCLGKINLTLYLMINGSILICLFRIFKSREISKVRLNKIISGSIEICAILTFIIYHLIISEMQITYLFFVLQTFIASILVCSAKYYNFNTIHKYNINFISNNVKIGDKDDVKEEILLDNDNENNDQNKKDEVINSLNINDDEEHRQKDEDNISTGSSSNNDNDSVIDEKIKKKKKTKDEYFSYEKIIFYEGIVCFSIWLVLILILSFIKCPESNISMFKILLCNNCTTMSGYESFFNSKELIIFNNVQYKNELIKYIYNYPICTIIFIIIIIITEFFYHFSFEKIFQGKYKTKLILLLNPIVSVIIFGAQTLGKKYSEADSFLDKILYQNMNISELLLCLALFIGSIISYLKFLNCKCKKRYK